MKTQDRIQHPAPQRPANWTPRTRNILQLSLHWIPGHCDFEENEDVDHKAKEAARGMLSPSKNLPCILHKASLPHSISAARQHHTTDLKSRWKLGWEKSRRYTHRMKIIDPSLPSPRYLKEMDNLTRPQSAIITQLRTGHISLNDHLFRIKRSPTPNCTHCNSGKPETVCHYLIYCKFFSGARLGLDNALRRYAYNLQHLLSEPKAFPHVLQFIKDSTRLKATFGNLTARQRT